MQENSLGYKYPKMQLFCFSGLSFKTFS